MPDKGGGVGLSDPLWKIPQFFFNVEDMEGTKSKTVEIMNL